MNKFIKSKPKIRFPPFLLTRKNPIDFVLDGLIKKSQISPKCLLKTFLKRRKIYLNGSVDDVG